MSKTCWSCGHFLIGGGCWKDGSIVDDGWKHVGPNDTCDGWVPEGTKGTVTENLQDEESNL